MGKKNKGNKNRGSLGDDFEDSYSYDSDDDSYQDYGRSNKKNKRNRNKGNDSYDDYGYDSYSNSEDYDNSDYDDSYDGYDDYNEEADDDDQDDSSLNDERQDDYSDSNYSHDDKSSHNRYGDSSYSDSSSVNSFKEKKSSPLAGMHPAKVVPSFSNASVFSDSSAKSSFTGGGAGIGHVSDNQETAPVFKPVTPVVASHATTASNSYTKELSSKTNKDDESFNSSVKKHEDDSLSASQENVEEDVLEEKEKPTGGVLSRLFHRKAENKRAESEEDIENEDTTSSLDSEEEEVEENAENTSEDEDEAYVVLRIEEIETELAKIEKDIEEYKEFLSDKDSSESDRRDAEEKINELLNKKKALKNELRGLRKPAHGEIFKKLRGVVFYPFSIFSKIPQFFHKKDVDDEKWAEVDETEAPNQDEPEKTEATQVKDSTNGDNVDDFPVRDWRRIAYRTTGVTIVATVLLATGYVGYLFWTHGHETPDEEVIASTENATAEKEQDPGWFDRVKAKFSRKSNKSEYGEELADNSDSSSKADSSLTSEVDSGVTEPSQTPKMAQMDLEKQVGSISDADAVDAALSTPLPSEVSGTVSSRSVSGDVKNSNEAISSTSSPLLSDSAEPVNTTPNTSVGELDDVDSEDIDDQIASDTRLPEIITDDSISFTSQASISSSPSSSTPTVPSTATVEEDEEDALISSSVDTEDLVASNSSTSNDIGFSTSEDLGVDAEEDLASTTPLVSNDDPSLDDTLAVADNNNAGASLSGAQWGSDDSSSWNSTASTQGNSIESATNANDLQSSHLGGNEVASLTSNNSLANNVVDDEPGDSFGSSLAQTSRSRSLDSGASNFSLRTSDSGASTTGSLSVTTSLQQPLEEAAPLTSLTSSSLGAGESDASSASLSLVNQGLLDGDETSGSDLDLHLGDTSNALLELTDESDLNALSGAGASLTNDYSSVAENLDSSGVRNSLTSAVNNGGNSLSNALSNFEDGVDNTVQGINDVAEGVRNRIDSFSQAVEEEQNRFLAQKETVTNSVNSSLASLSNSLESSRNSIREGVNNLTETVEDAYENSVTSLKNTGDSLRSSLQGLQNSLGLPENGLSSNSLFDNSLSSNSLTSGNSPSLIQEEEGLSNSLASGASDSSLSLSTAPSEESSASTFSLRGNQTATSPSLLQEEVGNDENSAPSISGLSYVVDDSDALEASNFTENLSTLSSLTDSSSTPRAASSGNYQQALGAPQRTSVATSPRETTEGSGIVASSLVSNNLSNLSTTTADNSLVANQSNASTSSATSATTSTNTSASSSPVSFGRTGVRKRLQSSVMTTSATGGSGASELSSRSASTTVGSSSVDQGTTNVLFQSSSSTPSGNSVATTSSASSGTTKSSDEYRVYVTKEGDNLLTIAQNELGSSSRWGEIRRINNLRSGAAYFEAGTRLLLPLSTTSGN